MSSPSLPPENGKGEMADKHAVILINYMRRHHVLAFTEFAKRVGKLTILVSTPMEGNRQWEPQWDGLDVIVQNNSTITLKRSSGFKEENYIHLPWDTVTQLRALKPDIVFSYEMGMRTLFSSVFRMFNRKTPLVLVGNMSEGLEVNRGILRRCFRQLVKSSVDYCTYNGPSCRRYLEGIGVPPDKLFHFPYCYDNEKTYTGDQEFSEAGINRLLYCGSLNERKGILPFTRQLSRYCDENMDRQVELLLAGDGPYRDALEQLNNRNLNIQLLGSCDSDKLRELYATADACVFPTLGDEWGLVPVEAWASGLPVIGSIHAQSVEAICQSGQNGWSFDSTSDEDTRKALRAALATTKEQLQEMSVAARESVRDYSAANSAEHLCKLMSSVLAVESCKPSANETASVAAASSTDSTGSSATAFATPVASQERSRPDHRPLATMSLDLDNKWSYLKSHNDPSWESMPSFLPAIVPRILSVLDELDVKITFFVVGQDAVIEQNHEALKMLVEHGHEIGNHSFHHEPCLHLYSPDELRREFELTENAIEKVTGVRTRGFRGPGFSLSDRTLDLLVERGYRYDCTTFPTYMAPLARAYYFMSGSFNKSEREERKAMFGRFSDGFLSHDPYLWTSSQGSILELPVSTFPVIKTPMHATYLHYLASFSSLAATSYFASALGAFRLSQTVPSFLLHPLDFMGIEDAPELRFFPGMKVDRKTKLERIRKYLEMYCDKFQIRTMDEYATIALERQLANRATTLARSGIS